MKIFGMILLLPLVVLASEPDELLEKTLNKARSIDTAKSKDTVFIVKDIQNNSLLSNLGLKNGDKILEINGAKVSTMYEVLNSVDTARSLKISRNNEILVIDPNKKWKNSNDNH